MRVAKCLLGAAVAALALGSAARAADQSAQVPSSAVDASTMPVIYFDDQTPTTLTPAMYELDKTSFGKWMESNNLSITGFGEGGYFYDTNNPRLGTGAKDDSPTLIGFPGAYSNRGQLDQADMTVSKTIDKTKKWDFGFLAEAGYGTDDTQIHSYGILDNRAPATYANEFNSNPNAGSPRNQVDLVQANATVLVPIGTGLQIEMGKFVTLLGLETISPLGNQFYTHSYLFTYGIPLTQTGVLGIYTFPKLVNGNDLTVTAGLTRGWNESARDDNSAIDFLGSATTSLDAAGKFGLTVTASEGPEYFKDDSDYWSVVEAIPSYQVSDQLKVTADLLYGDFPHGAALAGDGTGNSAQWYSAALYAGYKVNSYATVNARAEYYRDQGGFTVLGAAGAVSANYYEGTFGVDIHPFPNNDILQWLQLRPEVREDLSDKTSYNAAHSTAITGAGDYSEFTVAMDVIMQF